MRGLGGGYTQLLLNGSPLPSGVTLDSIPPDTIERIELLRSTSAEAGAQGISGSINIIVRPRAGGTRASAKLGVGTTNDRPSAGATWNGSHQQDGVQSSLVLTLDRTDTHPKAWIHEERRDAAGAAEIERNGERDYVYRAETLNLGPRLRWALDTQTTLSVDAYLGINRLAGGQFESIRAVSGQELQYPVTDLDVVATTTTLRSSAELGRHIGNHSRLSAKVGWSLVGQSSDVGLDGFDSGGSATLRREVASDADDRTWITLGKYTLDLLEGHDLAIGWDAALARRSERRVQRDQEPALFEVADESYRTESRRLAIYTQDEWAVTELTSVYWGVRWEGWSTKSTGSVIEAVNNRSAVLSPVAQVVVRLPSSGTRQLRAAIARNYKAPSTADLMPRRFVAKNNSAVTPNYQGNPQLRPELAWSLDLAFEWAQPRAEQVNIAAYYRDISSITRLELFEQGGTWINRPFNGGRARTWGIEIDGRTPLAFAPGSTMRANANWNDSRIDDLPPPDNRVNGQVPLSANLGLDLAPAGRHWGGGFNMSWQRGGSYQVSERLLYRTGSTRAADAYLTRRIGPATLRASVSSAEVRSEDRQYVDPATSMRQFVRNRDTRQLRMQIDVPMN